MSKRQLVPVVLVLVLGLLAGAVWLEPTRTIRGLVRRESFFGGRSTSYWRTALRSGEVEPLKAGGGEAVPVLAESLSDRDPEVRKHAAELLGALGPQAKDAADALLRAVGEGDDKLDAETLGFLRTMAEVRAKHPGTPLEVQDPDRAAQDAAAEALKKVDPQAAAKAGLP